MFHHLEDVNCNSNAYKRAPIEDDRIMGAVKKPRSAVQLEANGPTSPRREQLLGYLPYCSEPSEFPAFENGKQYGSGFPIMNGEK